MARGYESPFGLSRWALMSIYSIMLVLYSNTAACPDYIRSLLVLNKTGIDHCDTPFIQKQWINSIINRGFASSIATNFIAGTSSNHKTPRVTAIKAVAAFFCGLILLFVSDIPLFNTAGIIILGLAYPFGINAQLHIMSLFPPNSDVVQDILGSACDLSQFVPLIWLYLANNSDSERPMESAIAIYGAVFAIFAIFHWLCIPSDPFDDLRTQEFVKEIESTAKREHVYSAYAAQQAIVRYIEDKAAFLRCYDGHLLDDLTTIEQVVHPLFWLLAAFFSIALFVKFHLLSTFRFTITEYAAMTGVSSRTAEIVIQALNVANGFTWIGSTYFTRVADRGSCVLLSLIMSVCFTLSMVLYCIPNVYIQIVTIASFWLCGTIAFNYVYIAIIEYFGENYLNSMQGVIMMGGGFSACLHPAITEWLGEPYIRDELNLSTYTTPIIAGLRAFQLMNIGVALLTASTLGITYYEFGLLTEKKKLLKEQGYRNSGPTTNAHIPSHPFVDAALAKETNMLKNMREKPIVQDIAAMSMTKAMMDTTAPQMVEMLRILTALQDNMCPETLDQATALLGMDASQILQAGMAAGMGSYASSDYTSSSESADGVGARLLTTVGKSYDQISDLAAAAEALDPLMGNSARDDTDSCSRGSIHLSRKSSDSPSLIELRNSKEKLSSSEDAISHV